MSNEIKELNRYLDDALEGFGYDFYKEWLNSGQTKQSLINELKKDTFFSDETINECVNYLFDTHQKNAIKELQKNLDLVKQSIRLTDESNTALYLLLNDMNKQIEEMKSGDADQRVISRLLALPYK